MATTPIDLFTSGTYNPRTEINANFIFLSLTHDIQFIVSLLSVKRLRATERRLTATFFLLTSASDPRNSIILMWLIKEEPLQAIH